MPFERFLYRGLYRRARRPEDLVWHRDTPPSLLVEAIEGRTKPGRALDVGCGAGVFSVFLAQAGYTVTAIDFVPAALEMARRRAADAGVAVDFQQADAFSWPGIGRPFDVILDSGCLHSFGSPALRGRYRRQLMSWLAPGGDYVLVHFGRRHLLDWRPLGPRRRTREAIAELFAPHLSLRMVDEQVSHLPVPIGPTAQILTYWFRRLP